MKRLIQLIIIICAFYSAYSFSNSAQNLPNTECQGPVSNESWMNSCSNTCSSNQSSLPNLFFYFFTSGDFYFCKSGVENPCPPPSVFTHSSGCTPPPCETGQISKYCGENCFATSVSAVGKVGHGQSCPEDPPTGSDQGCVTNGDLSSCPPSSDPNSPTNNGTHNGSGLIEDPNGITQGGSSSGGGSSVGSGSSNPCPDNSVTCVPDTPKNFGGKKCDDQTCFLDDFCRQNPGLAPLCTGWTNTDVVGLCPNGGPVDPNVGCDYNYNPPSVTCQPPTVPDNNGNCVVPPPQKVPQPPKNYTPPSGGTLPPYTPPSGQSGVVTSVGTSGSTTNVSVDFDTSGIESRIDETNGLLNQIKALLKVDLDIGTTTSQIDSAKDGALTSIENSAKGYLEGIEFTEQTSLGGLISSIVPSGSGCSDYTLNLTSDIVMTYDLCRLAPVQQIIGWLFYAYTAWYLFQLLTGLGRKAQD